eukprot:scpid21603/ scgid16432/ 
MAMQLYHFCISHRTITALSSSQPLHVATAHHPKNDSSVSIQFLHTYMRYALSLFSVYIMKKSLKANQEQDRHHLSLSHRHLFESQMALPQNKWYFQRESLDAELIDCYIPQNCHHQHAFRARCTKQGNPTEP